MSPAAVSGGFREHTLPVLLSQTALGGFIRKLSGTRTSLLGGTERAGQSGKGRSLNMDDFCFAEPEALLSSSHFEIQSAGFVLAAINWLSHHFLSAVVDLCQ